MTDDNWTTRRFRIKLQTMQLEELGEVPWSACIQVLKLGNDTMAPDRTIKIRLLDHWRITGDKKVFRDYKIAGPEFFCMDRYIAFTKERMQGWSIFRIADCIARFGEIRGCQLNEEARSERARLVAGYYDVGCWMAKGLSEKAAESKVEAHRASTLQTLAAFITRHGEEEGNRRFQAFVQKSIQTRDKFIARYGADDGDNRWRALRYARDTNSNNYFQTRFGDQWEVEKAKRVRGTTITRDRYVERYGEIEGNIRYDSLVQCRMKKILPGATKASLVLFAPLAAFLAERGINFYVGTDKREYHVYSRRLKRHFYFDFVAPALRLAIEYHGIHCHPNPALCPIDRVVWRCAYRNIGYDEALSIDRTKKEVLYQERGFDMIEVYSDEFEANSNHLIDLCIAEFERRLHNEDYGHRTNGRETNVGY